MSEAVDVLEMQPSQQKLSSVLLPEDEIYQHHDSNDSSTTTVTAIVRTAQLRKLCHHRRIN
jgi:hypothetical protein